MKPKNVYMHKFPPFNVKHSNLHMYICDHAFWCVAVCGPVNLAGTHTHTHNARLCVSVYPLSLLNNMRLSVCVSAVSPSLSLFLALSTQINKYGDFCVHNS